MKARKRLVCSHGQAIELLQAREEKPQAGSPGALPQPHTHSKEAVALPLSPCKSKTN